MNELDGGGYSSSAIYENPYILNGGPLEVNRPNPNLVVLINNFGPGESFVEGGDGPLSYFTKGVLTLETLIWEMWSSIFFLY